MTSRQPLPLLLPLPLPPPSSPPPRQPPPQPPPELETLPGHAIRRLQQIAVAIFLEETAAQAITPVQFAALAEVGRAPQMDQRTLARRIGFDTSTLGGVIDRLQAPGLVQRNPSAQDRRLRLLTLTDAGTALLADVLPPMLRAQQRIPAPLAPEDRQTFLTMLHRLIEANNGLSRAPSDA